MAGACCHRSRLRARRDRRRRARALVHAVVRRRRSFRELFLNTDPEGYARCCEALSRFDVREALSAVGVPTLVVAGADDPSTPPAEVEAVARSIPNARFEVIADAAHLVNVERADDFNRLLKEHL